MAKSSKPKSLGNTNLLIETGKLQELKNTVLSYLEGDTELKESVWIRVLDLLDSYGVDHPEFLAGLSRLSSEFKINPDIYMTIHRLNSRWSDEGVCLVTPENKKKTKKTPGVSKEKKEYIQTLEPEGLEPIKFRVKTSAVPYKRYRDSTGKKAKDKVKYAFLSLLSELYESQQNHDIFSKDKGVKDAVTLTSLKTNELKDQVKSWMIDNSVSLPEDYDSSFSEALKYYKFYGMCGGLQVIHENPEDVSSPLVIRSFREGSPYTEKWLETFDAK